MTLYDEVLKIKTYIPIQNYFNSIDIINTIQPLYPCIVLDKLQTEVTNNYLTRRYRMYYVNMLKEDLQAIPDLPDNPLKQWSIGEDTLRKIISQIYFDEGVDETYTIEYVAQDGNDLCSICYVDFLMISNNNYCIENVE